MQLLTLFLLALGLSMDAFAVSVSNGLCYQGLQKKHIFAMAGTFGFFQAFMPLVGYFLGQMFRNAIVAFDHWVAFGLLALIGGHMILEAVKEIRHPALSCKTEFCSYKKIFIQGIATSIDALAVGVSLAIIPDTNIWWAAFIIGTTTFLCSLVGVKLGRKAGNFLKGRSEIAGGLILVGIGIKILVEHMMK
jgi:putative Mn2+ efflux pump MntP